MWEPSRASLDTTTDSLVTVRFRYTQLPVSRTPSGEGHRAALGPTSYVGPGTLRQRLNAVSLTRKVGCGESERPLHE